MEEMLGSDDVWRAATWLMLAGVAVLYLLGGFLTRIAGSWRQADGTLLTLHQLGPWVWGESHPPGGQQLYRGQAVFGRIRLFRRDRGHAHLRGLGFSPEQAAVVEGRQTGSLHLRRARGDLLVGTFVGLAFSFDGDKVAGSRPAEPVPRRLSRS